MKTLFYIFSAFPLFFYASEASALSLPKPIESYSCRVLLVTGVAASDGDWSFTALRENGSHGGLERVFAKGDYSITILASGTWLGISWRKKEVKIAEGLFVMSPDDTANNRVAILYNPANSDQVSLGCDKN